MGGHLLLLPTAPWTIYVSLDFCAKVFRLKTNYLPYATHTILGNFGVACLGSTCRRLLRKNDAEIMATKAGLDDKFKTFLKNFMGKGFHGRCCCVSRTTTLQQLHNGRIVANNLRKNGTFLRSSLLLILINGQGSQIEILKSYLLAPGKRALITQKTSQEKNLALS